MKLQTITKFEPKNLDALRPIIEKALMVLEKYGLTVQIGKIAYDDTQFTTKLEVKTRNNGESEFKKYALMLKLKPEWFGKSFQDGKDTFEIIGLSGRPKFPVQVRNTTTQKVFSYAGDAIRLHLGDGAKVEEERRQQFADNWGWIEHSADQLPGLQIEWLGKKITLPDGTETTIIGLDDHPYGRKKPNVVILDPSDTLRVVSVPIFVELIKRHNKTMLNAA
jgi:hypothetical protein